MPYRGPVTAPPTLPDDVAAVFRDYPRIYFGCHRRHVRDPDSGALVSTHQVSILDHLDTVQPTILGELAEHMGVTPGTMSIAVGRLVRQGYVDRVLDPADRRRVQLRLTDAGARVRAAHSVLEPDLVADMLAELPAAERRAALDGLAALARAAVAAQQRRSRSLSKSSRA
ncbi:regulatory protein MarR (plasmid) [Gemmatirosa kalamazoonensis]|uniref:Regulatory protein MarR n=1 Tax=Gemmatirosa kalamazoonensis TaxID=861299 RepID=W0RU89_9BACT|nr:regulatory protein MarR [Gemmatirosa kalamazoonensis]